MLGAAGIGHDAVLVALAGLVGTGLTVLLQQWNRRAEKRDMSTDRTITARVADTEAALTAWDKINNFQAEQIKTLTQRVNDLETRVQAYEKDVVPQMQTVIDALRATLNEKQATIDKQQSVITQLLETRGEST